VFRNCDVFVNGWFIGHHDSGYGQLSLRHHRCGRLRREKSGRGEGDASDFEGWFYEGAGIYRHVWLVKTAPVAIAPDGILFTAGSKTTCRRTKWKFVSKPCC